MQPSQKVDSESWQCSTMVWALCLRSARSSATTQGASWTPCEQLLMGLCSVLLHPAESSRSMRNISVQGWTWMLYVCVLHVPDGGSNVLPKRKPRRELERLTETKQPGHQILLGTAPMRFAANKNFRAGTLRLGLRSFGCGASGHSASLQAVFKAFSETMDDENEKKKNEALHWAMLCIEPIGELCLELMGGHQV